MGWHATCILGLRDRGAIDTPKKGKAMKVEHGDTVYVGPEAHKAARPMKVVVADNGCTWLCDTGVDESKDLEEQGCWRCADVPFTRND